MLSPIKLGYCYLYWITVNIFCMRQMYVIELHVYMQLTRTKRRHNLRKYQRRPHIWVNTWKLASKRKIGKHKNKKQNKNSTTPPHISTVNSAYVNCMIRKPDEMGTVGKYQSEANELIVIIIIKWLRIISFHLSFSLCLSESLWPLFDNSNGDRSILTTAADVGNDDSAHRWKQKLSIQTILQRHRTTASHPQHTHTHTQQICSVTNIATR